MLDGASWSSIHSMPAALPPGEDVGSALELGQPSVLRSQRPGMVPALVSTRLQSPGHTE